MQLSHAANHHILKLYIDSNTPLLEHHLDLYSCDTFALSRSKQNAAVPTRPIRLSKCIDRLNVHHESHTSHEGTPRCFPILNVLLLCCNFTRLIDDAQDENDSEKGYDGGDDEDNEDGDEERLSGENVSRFLTPDDFEVTSKHGVQSNILVDQTHACFIHASRCGASKFLIYIETKRVDKNASAILAHHHTTLQPGTDHLYVALPLFEQTLRRYNYCIYDHFHEYDIHSKVLTTKLQIVPSSSVDVTVQVRHPIDITPIVNTTASESRHVGF